MVAEVSLLRDQVLELETNLANAEVRHASAEEVQPCAKPGPKQSKRVIGHMACNGWIESAAEKAVPKRGTLRPLTRAPRLRSSAAAAAM